MKRFRRISCMLLALCMVLGCFACTKPAEPGTPSATAAPAKPADNAPTAAPEPTPEPLPYWVYDYAYGYMKITVDNDMPAQPQDDGKSLLFTDPNGKWTLSFTPVSVTQLENQTSTLVAYTEMKKDFGYYQNVVIEDRTGVYTDSAIKVTYLAFERNPDWVPAKQGYTTGAQEAHAYWIFNYGDTYIGPWGGLIVQLSLPEKTTDPLAPVLEDKNLLTLLENNEFMIGGGTQSISIPGITAEFPARWQNVSSDGKGTLWASIQGETKGSIYIGTTIYADPKVAAGYINPNYRTLTFNGREWYGEVRTSTLSGTTLKALELFSEFTEYHAASVKLNLRNWTSDEDFWKYTESDTFKAIMEGLVLDPASFHNPEDDYKDASGFTCNNINEISAYTGTETDLVIPAVIGENEIVGINTNLFKNNTSITSVVISEGIVYVEYAAFRGCTNLKSVVLPNSLTYIDMHAFQDCTALESITFGDGLIEIDNEAFDGCSALGDVLLPTSVVRIGNDAFYRAGSGSGRFECPADGTVYGSNALAESHFSSVEIGTNANLSDHHVMSCIDTSSITIGDGCTELGEYFAWDVYDKDTKLTTVNLPDTIKKIGMNAFYGRKGLASVDLGTVETLGESAFYGTGLREIVVPGTVKAVPRSCFENCPYVMTITISEGVESLDEWAFSYAGRHYDGIWEYDFFTEEEAAQHPEYVPNGSEPYSYYVKVYVPSTLQTTGYGAFCGIIGSVYMLWCTDPSMLPTNYDKGTFASTYLYQIFFTQEAIEAHGSAFDAYCLTFDRIKDIAWYEDTTKSVYWNTNPENK
ncbi:MAG: leucine-rich repeat domain-containing protein [Clostridia bacterium]|nr:leucine-rich repeat domain-containing protein [Clostridia bacterium]